MLVVAVFWWGTRWRAGSGGFRAVRRGVGAVLRRIILGLLGGIVVLLWELGHTGRGVLVLGAVLVVVTVVLLVRRVGHAVVVVPVAAVVAARVYALVPAAVDEWFPVLAG